MIRGKPLVAVDGTHASGKTTLLYGLASRLRERGHDVVLLPEPARHSPLVDDVVLRGIGDFDLTLEAELLASHVRQVTRASRAGSVLLSDRTPLNVIVYSRLLLDLKDGSWEQDLLQSMITFAHVWQRQYDMVLFCVDKFDQSAGGDRYRQKVTHLQEALMGPLADEYENSGALLVRVPEGLSNDRRLDFALGELRERLDIK